MDLQPKQPEIEPITDATLTRSITISVIGILCCMACLLGATWAWFSSSVSTASNTITAASFDVKVKVKPIEQNGEKSGSTELVAGADGYYKLEAEKTYCVVLEKAGTASSGFCLFSIRTGANGVASVYYIGDTNKEIYKFTEDKTYTFTIKGQTDIYIRFTPMWGEYPENGQNASIFNELLVEFGAAPIDLPSESESTENSGPAETSQDEISDTTASQEQSAP